eukprot:TRINITY_DN27581_c0_g1_i1.p1 TRINITY_DN27581_c0_g1~~TRINITY_DN27581_c0_g1_i1.p1  ORF type:complete len:284 (+),score=34.75 TRINITY_DN27581_c0_g1_i1:61-912(+)
MTPEVPARPRGRAGTTAASALATTPCRDHFTTGRCGRQQCPYLHDAERAEEGAAARRGRATSAPPPREPETWRGLPVFTWSGPKESETVQDDDDDDERVCAICLEPFANGKPLTALPCIHKFHAECVFPWIRKQGTCPKCFFLAAAPETSDSRPRPSRAHSEPRRSAIARAENGRWLVTPTPNYEYSQPTGMNMVGEVLFGPQGGGVAWVPNSISNTCMLCAASFSTTRRRHHCRVCGILSCRRCIVKKPVHGYVFEQYCCLQCLATYQRREGVIAPPWGQMP